MFAGCLGDVFGEVLLIAVVLVGAAGFQVLDVIEQVEKESQNRWQPDPAPVEGVCYQQLVAALREVLDRRTELARIAGVI